MNKLSMILISIFLCTFFLITEEKLRESNENKRKNKALEMEDLLKTLKLEKSTEKKIRSLLKSGKESQKREHERMRQIDEKLVLEHMKKAPSTQIISDLINQKYLMMKKISKMNIKVSLQLKKTLNPDQFKKYPELIFNVKVKIERKNQSERVLTDQRLKKSEK